MSNVFTEYQDKHFYRERDARWAVLLDNLGDEPVKWEYHTRTLRLELPQPDTYSPTFFLPEVRGVIKQKTPARSKGLFVVVSGTPFITDLTKNTVQEVSRESPYPSIIVSGVNPRAGDPAFLCHYYGENLMKGSVHDIISYILFHNSDYGFADSSRKTYQAMKSATDYTFPNS